MMKIPTTLVPIRWLAFLVVWSLTAVSFADRPISFNRDVRPILSDRCFKCHGPDATNQQSELRLDTREHALADLGGYVGIIPGDLDGSLLHQRIHSQDEFEVMPPTDCLHPLTEAEKKILDQWILEGAPYDQHWSFKPLPDEVVVPNSTTDWGFNAVDQFVATALEREGLEPNHDAPREKWLRRVTFDLTGLPPTVSELDAFVNDSSDSAYQKVVDRLLRSDACAERLASEWLDVARYSDSYGYQRDDERFVWPWRDWVIRAFADNLSYDQFLTWQLAGDLLPNPSTDQRLATAFNRLHSHKKEGGVAIEEFRVENVADRTHTVASAFMGLTFECSRCHDHKYDPITMKDYYQLTSFFANIDERGLISYFTDAVPTPAMPLPSMQQQAQLSAALNSLKQADQALAKTQQDCEARFEDWLKTWRQTGDAPSNATTEIGNLVASLSFETTGEASKEQSFGETGKAVSPGKMQTLVDKGADRPPAITPKTNRLVPGRIGQAIQLTGDDAVVLPGAGHFPRHQPFSVALWFKAAEVEQRAVIYRRSRGWDDAGSIGYELTQQGDQLVAKLVHFWPGNAIGVQTPHLLKAGRWYHVVVTYDGSSTAKGLTIHLDGVATEGEVLQDSLTRNITQWRQGYQDLAIGSRYRDRGFKDGIVDEFRVFDRQLASVEISHLYDGKMLSQLRSHEGQLTNDQRGQLREYYLTVIDEDVRNARQRQQEMRQAANAIRDAIPAITVMREQAKPRQTFVLTRGVYDQRGDLVQADAPSFLPPFPASAPRNRLGLAQWLTDDDHPLTARVTVNRYWQMVFGEGLVRTPEDFGNQGQAPTHPELLDWLARDFVAHGWDVRRLLRTMVLSATYRQSAIVSPEAREKDPENVWWSRGPSQRLSAEMIRDNALAVSGLLVPKVGGPPVKPYDLALAYTPLKVDEGQGLYRRSLYTFWKRTSPSPVMMTMNANKREVCRLRREVTDSPLQALVLLNGPQFTEAATKLATRLIDKHGLKVDDMVKEAFRLLLSRGPSTPENAIMKSLYQDQYDEYQNEPGLAAALLGISVDQNEPALESDLEERSHLAAMTILVSIIMNHDECVRHQ